MREDHLAEVLNDRRGQPDLRHLQLVEPDRLAATGLFAPKLHPLPRAGDAVEHRHDVRRLTLQLRERLREQRHRQVICCACARSANAASRAADSSSRSRWIW